MNLGQETEQLEFKRSTSELKEGCESIASILNKHGSGVLYFGVAKNGLVKGQEVSESTLRQVSQAIGNCIEPSIFPCVEKVTLDDADLVRVTFEGDDAPYSCRGRFRIRVSDEDKPMPSDEVRRKSAEANYRIRP